MSNFINSDISRILSRKNEIILNEIQKIEYSILISSRDGKFETTVDDTFMTSITSSAAPLYYNTWKYNDNEERADHMNQVIFYFDNLGYDIKRITNLSSLNTFKWKIRW
jgi:hypothetical protein